MAARKTVSLQRTDTPCKGFDPRVQADHGKSRAAGRVFDAQLAQARVSDRRIVGASGHRVNSERDAMPVALRHGTTLALGGDCRDVATDVRHRRMHPEQASQGLGAALIPR